VSERNVEIVRRMLDAFYRDDVAGVIDAFDEGCELHEPRETPDTPAQGFRGHAGIRAWMANLRSVGGIQFEPTDLRAVDGDVVFAELAARGRGRASGASFDWRTFAVVHLRDERIARIRAFLGRDEALVAAGLRD
jgi:ketosteroid isomerase-like protein